MIEYYKILGLNQGASISDIKKAFRKKAKELHPDVNKAADAHEQFLKLCEAYEICIGIRDFSKKTITQHEESYQDRVRKAKEKARKYAVKQFKDFIKSHQAYRETVLSKVINIINYLGFLLVLLTLIDCILPTSSAKFATKDLEFSCDVEGDFWLYQQNRKMLIIADENLSELYFGDSIEIKYSTIFSFPKECICSNDGNSLNTKVPFERNFPVLAIFLMLPLISIIRSYNSYDKVFMNEFLRIVGVVSFIGSLVLLIFY